MQSKHTAADPDCIYYPLEHQHGPVCLPHNDPRRDRWIRSRRVLFAYDLAPLMGTFSDAETARLNFWRSQVQAGKVQS